ncbi:MAG: hypothetical protein ACYS8W_07550 [Planctomycetota bacterium]|jgi:hypothetical protein
MLDSFEEDPKLSPFKNVLVRTIEDIKASIDCRVKIMSDCIQVYWRPLKALLMVIEIDDNGLNVHYHIREGDSKPTETQQFDLGAEKVLEHFGELMRSVVTRMQECQA